MSDLSVPVGDRNEPPAVTGPDAVRQALNQAPATFAAQVTEQATLRGWLVHGVGPTYWIVKGDTLIVAHISPASGYHVNELLAKLRQVKRVVGAHWKPSEGLGPVVDALAGEAS